MRLLGDLIILLLVPLAVFNMAAGAVSALWLFFSGDWQAVLQAIAVGIIGPFTISIAMMISLPFIVGAAGAAEAKNGLLSFILGVPAILWTYLVMLVWAVGSFWYFSSDQFFDYRLPFAILAYSVAIGPWSFIAQKETQSDPNSLSGFSTTMLAITSVIAMSFVIIKEGHFLLINLITLYAVILSITAAIMLWLSYDLNRQPRF